MKSQAKILIVDDEPGIREMLSYELSFREYKVTTAVNGEDALDKLRREKFNLVISDVKMPKMSGLEMLEAIKKTDPNVEVIMSTGYGTIETAVNAMKMGAYDFVQKPFNIDEILAIIERALEKNELKALLEVYEAGKVVFSSLKLNELLPSMAGLSLKIIKADDVSIMLLNPDGKLSVAAAAGLEDDARKDTRLILGERIAGKVAVNKEAVVINGPVDKDPRFSDIDSLREIRSAIVFPLVMEGTTLGVLNANRTSRGDPFTQADLRYATVFCNQISQAIHNAKLYHELDAKMREIQRMQDQLVEAEKLSAIGKLAAGVAHEINNPLTGIMCFAELLLTDKGLSAQQREDMESILQQSQRCRRIVQNLLQFSRRKKGETGPVDTATLVEAVLQLSKYDLTKANIEVEKNFPADLPAIQGDFSQLEQVFLNLLTNARQALEGRKNARLRIGASEETGRVVIRFEDNGCGIPKENLARIFDPFFTTKMVGQGTGLGLSISYGIIQQHNGTIKVESKTDAGTTFIIVLPASTGNKITGEK